MIRSAVLNCKAYQCLCFRKIGSTILLQIILQLQVSIKTQFILCQTLSETRMTSFLVMHLLVEFHKNYNCFLPFTVPVIHKVPLEVIPRIECLQGASAIPTQSHPTFSTRSSACCWCCWCC